MVSHLILVQRAKENDFAFFKDMQIEANCPEYNGYKTSLVRQAGLVPEPKTEVAFLPLIDCLPAHHDTIKTAIVKGLTLVKAAGQEALIFTVDQQLYKVTIDILFHQPSYFKYVIPVLGGMHMLMNFIHSIAVIMAGSGMKDILASTFGSVDKMLSGKKYPQNFCALRMPAEEIIHNLVLEEGITRFDSLISVLDTCATQSRTTKL